MNAQNPLPEYNSLDWACPDLTPYWKLAKVKNFNQIVLKAKQGQTYHLFSSQESFALRYFTGQFTITKVQKVCQQEFGETLAPDFVINLLQKLIELNVLALDEEENGENPDLELLNTSFKKQYSPKTYLKLKDCVQWIKHPDGYWILRNPEDVKFIQVTEQDKTIIDQLGRQPMAAVAAEFGISQNQIKYLLQMLTVTAMLEGTTPPQPPKRKFNPMQLLFFRIPLFNPDPWLSQHINGLRWIWTQPVALLLGVFLTVAALMGYSQHGELLQTGQQLLAHSPSSLLLPFGLLTMLVVTLHELGHAFTLKYYGGIIPQIGLLMIMFMPAAYTDTSDSYCLVKRYQRVLVIGGGVLVQLIIAAISLFLWNGSSPGTWLNFLSYLLMSAALFTVALNLNPLAKFDGYYLAVALTGINNLRSRGFRFYKNLFTGNPIQERKNDALILALYAPLSFVYIYFVFSFLYARIADWLFTNIPILSLMFLLIWAIYYFLPQDR
jgi:putative peptide zinc metalloprotease protein